MVKGGYSQQSRSMRAVQLNYAAAPIEKIFVQQTERKAHESMSPYGVKVRESLDTEDHPAVLPIIFAMDETGSQYEIPVHLVREGLPKIMSRLHEAGYEDAQLLFMGVGDHLKDDYPLQVGQFESTDELMDKWLTRIYLEGNGGGNGGESYFLPWYFAAFHTKTDQWDKRREKGVLFTTGDEIPLKEITNDHLKRLMGDTAVLSPNGAYTPIELLKAAQEKYHVFHLLTLEGTHGRQSQGYWTELLGDNCIPISNDAEIPHKVAKVVADIAGTRTHTQTVSSEPAATVQREEPVEDTNEIL